MYLTLTPSYGRDYKSAAAVRADWATGKDFTIASVGPCRGRQVNKEDAPPGAVLNIRYKRLTRVCVVRT